MRFYFAQWLSFRHSLQGTWIWTNGKKIKQLFYWFVNSYYFKGISFRKVAFLGNIFSKARIYSWCNSISSIWLTRLNFSATYFFMFFFFHCLHFTPHVTAFFPLSFTSLSILSICFNNNLYFLIFPFHFLSFLCSESSLQSCVFFPVLHIVSQDFLLICDWLIFLTSFLCLLPQTLLHLLQYSLHMLVFILSSAYPYSRSPHALKATLMFLPSFSPPLSNTIHSPSSL